MTKVSKNTLGTNKKHQLNQEDNEIKAKNDDGNS